jgi:hypothetical protein
METSRKSLLQGLLLRERPFCSFAEAAALCGTKPGEILPTFSFEEFKQLVERMRDDSPDSIGINKERQ